MAAGDRYTGAGRVGRDNHCQEPPETIDQRSHSPAGQGLVRSWTPALPSTVPALTKRDTSRSSERPPLDHGDTIGTGGLRRPSFYLKQFVSSALADPQPHPQRSLSRILFSIFFLLRIPISSRHLFPSSTVNPFGRRLQPDLDRFCLEPPVTRFRP